jgi:hypothetical protein
MRVANSISGAYVYPGTEAFIMASLVGAAIALIGARLLIPLSRSTELFFTGLAAAVVGGFGFVLAGEQRLGHAFALWHSVMALAIYTAETVTLSFGSKK